MYYLILTLQLLVIMHGFAELSPILPPPLKKGDCIAIVFPASFIEDDKGMDYIKKKAKWIESKGFKTVIYPKNPSSYGFLAGTDNERAKALMQAWKNPKVKAIWCFRGGYGSCRILDKLDYEWIKSHPKVLIGMSDITALHQAIHKKTGLITFLGPVLDYFDNTNKEFDDEYAFSSFEQTFIKQQFGKITMPNSSTLSCLTTGKAKGKFVGGTLSIIASLCGTPWQLNTDNKILVLEDVGEETYRIDRMLWQLKNAGLLNRPAAVILGDWKNWKMSAKNNFSLLEVLKSHFSHASYPVMINFPTGHGKFQTFLPLNQMGEVDCDSLTVKILK